MQRRNPEIDSSKINSYLEIVYMHIHGENTPGCEIWTIINVSNVCNKYCVYSRKR